MITCSLHNHCTLCDGRDTPESMLAAAEALEFERAADLRDQIKALQKK